VGTTNNDGKLTRRLRHVGKLQQHHTCDLPNERLGKPIGRRITLRGGPTIGNTVVREGWWERRDGVRNRRPLGLVVIGLPRLRI